MMLSIDRRRPQFPGDHLPACSKEHAGNQRSKYTNQIAAMAMTPWSILASQALPTWEAQTPVTPWNHLASCKPFVISALTLGASKSRVKTQVLVCLSAWMSPATTWRRLTLHISFRPLRCVHHARHIACVVVEFVEMGGLWCAPSSRIAVTPRTESAPRVNLKPFAFEHAMAKKT